MAPSESSRVGYVVKRYPRYSETFVVNEILAHEAAGLQIEVFSLFPSLDAHYQEITGRVRAPVSYLLPPEAGPTPKAFATEGVRAADFWRAIRESLSTLPGLWSALEKARDEQAFEVYQAVLLARAVRQRSIAHLHAHFANSATTVARLAARFARVPYSFTAHAKDIFHQSVTADNLRRNIEEATAVVTVSDYNLAYLSEKCGGPPGRVQRIYNGLPLEQFPFESPLTRPPIVVSVGRLVEKKGFEDLIDASAILAAGGHQFACQIIGTGPLRQELQTRIRDLGLEQKVELKGAGPQREVIRHVQRAAVFVGPYVVAGDGNRDGLPTALLEAMALGTPCVSTDVTGIPEILRHDETGLMVAQHARGDLAQAIGQLLYNPKLRVRLAAEARRLVETEFDIRRNSARLREIFQPGEQIAVSAAS